MIWQASCYHPTGFASATHTGTIKGGAFQPAQRVTLNRP